MHLKIGKKLNFFFYITIIIILTSINNYNLNFKDIFIIKGVDVQGFSKEKNMLIKNEIKYLLGKNIIFISKDYFITLVDRNDTKELIIKKVYPNKILFHFVPTKPICVIDTQNGKIILGDNGKLLDIKIKENNLPVVSGSNNIRNIYEVINLLIKSNLNYFSINNIFFYKSGRFDINLKNGVIIKFPINYSEDTVNYSSKLLNDKKFENSKIIDLRIKNRIIKYE